MELVKDNDPILKKLDKDIGDINDKAGERMKKTFPAKTLAMLKKYGLY